MTDITPMQLGTEAELELLKNAVILGVMMGVVYDLFRVIRHTLPAAAVRFACDLLYSLSFGAVFFVFSLSQTGYYRGFLLAGMLAGTVMWSATVGKALSFAAEKLIAAVTYLPARLIVGSVHKICTSTAAFFVRIRPKSEMQKKMPKIT